MMMDAWNNDDNENCEIACERILAWQTWRQVGLIYS